MRLNRREWMKQSAATALVLRTDGLRQAEKPVAPLTRNALALEPFADPLVLPPPLQALSRDKKGFHYRVDMVETQERMHRDMPPTRLWTYNGVAAGAVIVARAGEPVSVEWRNRLPQRHFLPIDYTLHGSGRDIPESRAIVHLHGSRTPAASDGYPESWYPPGRSLTFHYPNRQDAAMLWFHDHAMGTNRLNLYAGMMGVYLLRDAHEESLALPSGRYELPLMLYDRIYDTAGQLYYPVSEVPGHPWVEEVLGEAMVVNGRVTPFHPVEARRYRLRVVNAANGRFFRLALSNEASFLQIGGDQGLLPAPIEVESLVLAPGERADLIVDFAPMRGERVVLTNGGFQMMQFRVGSEIVEDASRVPQDLLPRVRLEETKAARTREMTLNSYEDDKGMTMVMLLNRLPWHMAVTEVVKLGSSEIWTLVNLSDDTHPIHLHHVRFQVLDRRPFDRDRYLLHNADLRYTAPAIPAKPNESGWKDVVQCPPNIVTRIHISFDGYPGRYLWHCHLQEHEANDMMRPYDIVA